MTMAEAAPGDIIEEGKVGRAVFSKRDWKNLRMQAAPWRLFFDNKSPVNLSVHLLDVKPDGELAAIGDELAKSREPGVVRTFYGWAELTVADASRSGREVRKLMEWWHADIVLPCGEDDNDKQEREMHASELAALAACRHRP